MIRSSTIYNAKPLQDIAAFMREAPQEAARFGEQLYRKYEPRMMQEVRYRPARSLNGLNSGRPFQWSPDPKANARARAWFFANYPNGYKRTGKWERGWQSRFDTTRNTFGFTIFGNGRDKEFTSGAMNRVERNRPIIGHLRSGYIPIKKTVDYWTEAYRDEYTREFPRYIATRIKIK